MIYDSFTTGNTISQATAATTAFMNMVYALIN